MEQEEFKSLLGETVEKLGRACDGINRGFLLISSSDKDSDEGIVSVAFKASPEKLAFLIASAIVENDSVRDEFCKAFKVMALMVKDYKDEKFPTKPKQ